MSKNYFFDSFPNYDLGLLMLAAGLTCLDNVLVWMCSMSEMGLYFKALDVHNNKCT